MTTNLLMSEEVYAALIEAGVTHDKAQRAAIACAGPYQDALRILSLQQEQHRILLRLKWQMNLMVFLQTVVVAWAIALWVL